MKLASISIDMGTLEGFASPFGPPLATSSPLASLGLAIPPAMVRHARRWQSRRALHAILVAAVAVSSATALAKGKEQKKAPEQVVTMEVTGEGFVPAQVKVKAGQLVKLVVTRKTDRTCAKEIVIKDFGIHQPLPLDQPVEITFTPIKPGQVRYACAMDMIAGVIIVE